MPERRAQIQTFLTQSGWTGAQMRPLAGDASTRRYYRVCRDTQCAILMDHLPQTGNITPFLNIAQYLQDCSFSAPSIIAADTKIGLILMEDLGNDDFARWLIHTPRDEELIYAAAVDLLFQLHQCPAPGGLVEYTPKMMADYIDPVFEFYVGPDVGADQKADILADLETKLLDFAPDTDCVILRDYHAENLIWLPKRNHLGRVGLLDFQDALLGHCCYDLASLLHDARRDVSNECKLAMIARYSDLSGQSVSDLSAAVAVLGAQRNLRILGIFAGLSLNQGKHHYIDLMPRVWGNLQDCLSHPALGKLRQAVFALLPEPDCAHLQRLKAS